MLCTYAIVFGVSALGWLLSLLRIRSALQRHAILTATLWACLLLPLAVQVRWRTNWTLLPIYTSRLTEAALSGREQTNPDFDLSSATASDGGLKRAISLQSPSVEGSTESLFSTTADAPDQSRRWDQGVWMTFLKKGCQVVYGVVATILLLQILGEFLWIYRQKDHCRRPIRHFQGIPVFEADVAVPMALGFGKPSILVPREFWRATDRQVLDDVLQHEWQHLIRGDHWRLLVQALLRAIYWPTPTFHLMNRALCVAREELRDNGVLAHRDPVAYAESLLSVAQFAARRSGKRLALAASILVPGVLETRVAGLLDDSRDRRTILKPAVRMAAIAVVGTMTLVTAAVRIVAATPSTSNLATDEQIAPRQDLTWTATPQVDQDRPLIHRGIVHGPDGKPLAGARIYAVSTVEALELASPEDVSPQSLGPVRATTDDRGRFEFEATDLSHVTPAGQRKRWETLLVAAKEGLSPAWLKTWGEDRSLRSHWHPHPSRRVLLHSRPRETLTGRLRIEGGAALVGAQVRLTGLMAPVKYDLETHIQQEETPALGLFSTIDYEEQLYRPWILPGLSTTTTTDGAGHFALEGLPEGFIAQLEIRHPKAATTNLRAAVRPHKPVFRRSNRLQANVPPTLTLYGSGFSAELSPGVAIRGAVVNPAGHGIENIQVAIANQNASDGLDDRPVMTDAQGAFELTGLRESREGRQIAAVGSFRAPYASTRQQLRADERPRIELSPAVPYRLKLADTQGQPLSRKVYSMRVQQAPGEICHDVTRYFNVAEEVAPGLYAGIVPPGPAVVFVERSSAAERPVAVDPKAFFASGRTDWTPAESIFAFGNSKVIATPAVVRVAPAANPTLDQYELAAAVFTDATPGDVLELEATVYSDSPIEFSLVDETGNPVTGARVNREMKRYNEEGLPAEFAVHGLHPSRAEFLSFYHEGRNLYGAVTTVWSGSPVRIIMRPAATLLGRLTDSAHQPSSSYFVRVIGDGIFPNTLVGGRVFQLTDRPGERQGEFRLIVPSLTAIRGEFIENTGSAPANMAQPGIGAAFGPLILQPGEIKDLGDLTKAEPTTGHVESAS